MTTNREIAAIFDTVADMLELKGEIIHRILAYRRAADSIRDYPRDVNRAAAENALDDIPHVGAILAEKIQEIVATGRLTFLDKLTEEIPITLVDVLRVNGVGPKKAMLFYKNLGVDSLDKLREAASTGKLASLPGMGAKSAQRILDGLEALARATDRVRIDVAMNAAESILNSLRELPEVLRADICGSLRRGKSTIGDIDLLIASENAAPIMETFLKLPNIQRILGQGETKSSVELLNGLQCDLRVVPPAVYGTALAYFTGSQSHNIRVRDLATQRGYTLNEWALTPLDSNTNGGVPRQFAEESDLHQALGLAYIPPELRENLGEIEAAQNNKLPMLITAQDIRSDLHMHTTWSDGRHSVREMAEIARSRGLSHIVITDHSGGLGITGGLKTEDVANQRAEIQNVDAQMRAHNFRVYQGVELEIRADGSLDFPDEVLASFDFVVASLHVSLTQPRDQITARLLNAIRNPHVDLIGHPRGQLLTRREGADLDMDAVYAAAREHGTALEINANPHRLDLDDAHAKRARELGIPLAIDCDAHSEADFDQLRYGLLTARRAWVTPDNVINTRSTEDFERYIRSRGL